MPGGFGLAQTALRRGGRRPIRLNQRQRLTGTGLCFHRLSSFLVFLLFGWTARELKNYIEVIVL